MKHNSIFNVEQRSEQAKTFCMLLVCCKFRAGYLLFLFTDASGSLTRWSLVQVNVGISVRNETLPAFKQGAKMVKRRVCFWSDVHVELFYKYVYYESKFQLVAY